MRTMLSAAFTAALALGFLVPSASAAPGFVPLQGYLTDAADVAIDGAETLHFALYEAAVGGPAVWSESQTIDLDAGLFTAYLGVEAALDLLLFADHPELHLGIAVGDGAEMDRILLGYSGYAGFAQACGEAATLGGLGPDALVTGAGDGLTLASGEVSLSAAGCGAGEVLKRSAANDGWVCGPDLLGGGEGGLGSVGAGLNLDAGTGELSVDQATIEGWARAVAFDTLAELTDLLDSLYLPAAWQPAWGDLSEVPQGFADGVDDDTTYTGGEGVDIAGGVVSLAPAASGGLGGVEAHTCGVGDKVVGIGTDGKVICAPDLTGDGSSGAPVPDTAAVALAIGAGPIANAVAVDGDQVYWAGQGVGRIPVAGGLSTVLSNTPSNATEVAVDGTHVYFVDGATSFTGSGPAMVGRVPKGGGDTDVLASALGTNFIPSSLILDDTAIYWGSVTAVHVLPKEGGAGAPVKLNDGGAEHLLLSDGEFWFVRNRTLTRLPKAGGVAVAVLDVARAEGLAADADNIFVASAGSITRVPKDGSRPRLLTLTPDPVRGFGAANGWLYFSTSMQFLGVVATDGSSAMEILAYNGGLGLTVAGDSLYWTRSTTTSFGVMRLPAL